MALRVWSEFLTAVEVALLALTKPLAEFPSGLFLGIREDELHDETAAALQASAYASVLDI